MLLNSTRVKGNQTIEFDQLKEYHKRNIFLEKNIEKNESGRLVPDRFLFFKIKNDILIALKLAYNTNKLYKTLD